MRKEKDRLLEYYKGLPYTIKIYPEEEGGYTAEIEELPGCITQGETMQEVLANIEEAKELWLETALDIGREIPLPQSMVNYSGKLLLRIPKYLHKRLAQLAKKERVSLNQLIVSLLSEASALLEVQREIREIKRLLTQSYRGEPEFSYEPQYRLTHADFFESIGEGEVA